MGLVLSFIGVAIGAFSVWLIVRMLNRRERWAVRTGLSFIAVAALYVASFGPACWLASRTIGATLLPVIYKPFTWGMSRQKPTPLDYAIRAYAKAGAAENWDWWYFAQDGKWLWEDPRL